jgi:hypothetical protein
VRAAAKTLLGAWAAQRDERSDALEPRADAPLLLHDDRRADLDPVIEIDHVLIGHANAAR